MDQNKIFLTINIEEARLSNEFVVDFVFLGKIVQTLNSFSLVQQKQLSIIEVSQEVLFSEDVQCVSISSSQRASHQQLMEITPQTESNFVVLITVGNYLLSQQLTGD